MSADREEPDKVLGMPRSYLGPHGTRGQRQDEEHKRVLGVPVDWYGPVDWDWLRSLRHPVRAYQRWTLIRRLGPYAPDERDPKSPG